MKAISLWQPWATWIAWGIKTIETRYHDRFYRLQGQTILIHAAKRFDQDAFYVASHFLEDIQTSLYKDGPYPKGYLLCTVFVIQHRLLVGSEYENTAALCPTLGKYGLFLENIKRLEKPIPYRGRQGIFEVPFHIIDAALFRDLPQQPDV